MDEKDGAVADFFKRPPKIKIPSRQQRALDALAESENGTEWDVLLQLAASVLDGDPIEPAFQTVVNAIVAKSVIYGKLPLKRRGRPKDSEGTDGRHIAQMYFDLKDAGSSYEEAVAQVASKFCKDERHVMRLVKEYKHEIGETVEERERNRRMWQLAAEWHQKAKAEGKQTYLEYALEILSRRESRDVDDVIEELEQIIDDALDQTDQLT